MRLFPPPLDVGDREGFSKEKDIFGRAGIGRGLTNIVVTADDPLVIAVDSEWGTGKTTFLKMWAGELRERDIPVIYFDAFEHDYVEDAFTAIAGEITTLATEKQKESDPATKKFLEKSMGAAKILLRSGIKLGVKLGTAGALNAADIGSIAGDFSKEASELEDRYIGELLTKQKQEKQILQSFREALEMLPSLLASTSSGPESVGRKPLIIIIDELDRCRPLFALQILERIKHFFSVSGVHFVLGTHLGQLRNSVAAVYGSGIDSKKYLQKFIHLTLHLVDSAIHPHQRVTTIFINHLMDKMELGGSNIANSAVRCFSHIARHGDLSLRTVERMISTFAIASTYRPQKVFCPDAILIGLCALKAIDPEVYVKAKLGRSSFDEVQEVLSLYVAADEAEKSSMEHMTQIWRYYSDRDVADDNPDFQGFGRQLWNHDLGRWDAIPYVARVVVDRLTQ